MRSQASRLVDVLRYRIADATTRGAFTANSRLAIHSCGDVHQHVSRDATCAPRNVAHKVRVHERDVATLILVAAISDTRSTIAIFVGSSLRAAAGRGRGPTRDEVLRSEVFSGRDTASDAACEADGAGEK